MTIQSVSQVRFRRQREAHWNSLADLYDHAGLKSGYHKRLEEIYRTIIPRGSSILEIGCGKGDLLAALDPAHGVGVDFSHVMLARAAVDHPGLTYIHADAHELGVITGRFDFIIFSDLLDDLWDVQEFLQHIRRLCHPSTRIVFNVYSHLWSLPLRLAQRAGFATPMLPQNWLTVEDLTGLLLLTDFTMISHRPEILCPVRVPFLSAFCNRYLAKIYPFSLLDLTHVIVARPERFPPELPLPTVSVIIPACNEAGNIAEILERIPSMGSGTEILFIEGGSSDNTYAVIEMEISRHAHLKCRLIKQTGTGKGDAVRSGFENASGDILMILDADLTVAPEDLPKFYHAVAQGTGEFINGVRLVYPMHEKAMRFFNLIGNKFFSMAFSWLFGQTVKDTLCGTKALSRSNYARIAAQRSYFGDFDPFGDFDLLLGAVRLNLKIVDLPVRYGERVYGETNIKRWSHGLLLFRMLIIAARKLKFI